MIESEGVPPIPPMDTDRFARLERRVAALEKLIATAAETTDFKLRALKRDISTVSRSIVQRGDRDG